MFAMAYFAKHTRTDVIFGKPNKLGDRVALDDTQPAAGGGAAESAGEALEGKSENQFLALG